MSTQTNGQANGQQNPPALTVSEKNMAENVLAKVQVFEETGTLHIPKDYSAANAIRIAWLMLQDVKDLNGRQALEVCTQASIANSLLKMVIQGLNPAKRQCSFIVYGNTLTLQREYQGAIAIAKRDAGLKRVTANAIFKGDEFAFTIDTNTQVKTVTKHVQTLESMDSGEVVGAYAVKEYMDGRKEAEIMPMSQIRKAWEMGKAKGQSPAHKNFPDQMAMKTVIARALKTDINSSDDSVLLEGVDEDLQQQDDHRLASVKHQISERANKQSISMDEPTDAELVHTNGEKVDTATGEVIDEQATNNDQPSRRGF